MKAAPFFPVGVPRRKLVDGRRGESCVLHNWSGARREKGHRAHGSNSRKETARLLKVRKSPCGVTYAVFPSVREGGGEVWNFLRSSAFMYSIPLGPRGMEKKKKKELTPKRERVDTSRARATHDADWLPLLRNHITPSVHSSYISNPFNLPAPACR